MDRIARPLLALPRESKRLMAAAVDGTLCALTVWLAFYLRLGYFVSLKGSPSVAVFIAILLALPTFYVTGLYRISFRRAGGEIVPVIAMACAVYALGYMTIITAYSLDSIPRTVGIIQPILLFLGASTVRIVGGYILSGRIQRRKAANSHGRVLIYGAGSSGRQLASAISTSREFDVADFIDDDNSLDGSHVTGLQVYSPKRLSTIVESKKVSDVFLALPSASRQRRSQIVEALRNLPVAVRTLPGLMDLAHGRVQASDLRELTIEDLLARDPVKPEIEAALDKIRNRTILVTGAGGSIGSELCRQITAAKPRRILLLENNEFSLYAIHRELIKATDVDVIPLLGSIVDEFRTLQVMQAWKPDMVFHAAAYKHVPLVEYNPLQGLRNNVIGTLRIAELSVRMGVKDFVLISTDKAVRPTNVMGATKRLAELILQGLATQQSTTRFSMVRFGNVLGSSGSVVPLFREQIRAGGPVTITHPDVTRYFMTIPEAAHLVLQASIMADGGEVFVLDMGDPVRIRDLAENMIQLSGFRVRDAKCPTGDIEIKVVGLRPGEKLFEELLIGNDPLPTMHPRVMKATEHSVPWSELRRQLDQLNHFIDSGDVVQARAHLRLLVSEFAPASDVVDWVTLASRETHPIALPIEKHDL